MSWFTRRRTAFLAALAFPVALTVAGCDGFDDDADYTDPGTYERTVPPAERDYDDDDDRMNEAQVLGIVRALNQGEVDHAGAVQGRFLDAGMQSLCESLLADHRAALVKLDQVAQATGITPSTSEKAEDFTKQVRDEIADMRDDEGEDLEDEFLEDQKGMHERALKLYDEELLPAATTPKLVQLLTELRGSVAAHLEAIKAVDEAR